MPPMGTPLDRALTVRSYVRVQESMGLVPGLGDLGSEADTEDDS
eukprot:SAG31_NODE_999_length_10457_cov_3.482622_1_plen_44_part_00